VVDSPSRYGLVRAAFPAGVPASHHGGPALDAGHDFCVPSIVDAEKQFKSGTNSAGTLALEALEVKSLTEYAAIARRFEQILKQKYSGDDYQQFFFKVVDDVGFSLADFYLDFYVLQPSGEVDTRLTKEFDKEFESEFTRHSADSSCRVLMLNVTNHRKYLQRLRQARAKLVFDITAKSPNRQIRYLPGYAVVFDSNSPAIGDEPTFLYPNTTTLVEIVLNRIQTDKVLHLLDHDLKHPVLAATRRRRLPRAAPRS
jgi:hypothetical protein